MYEEALAIGREVGNTADLSVIITNLAYILRERGDLEGAKKRCEEALALDEAGGLKSQVATDRYDIAELLVLMDRLGEARREHVAALALREELGEKLMVAESRLALAVVSLEEGNAEAAEAPAREAASLFHREHAMDKEATAQGILASVLLARGHTIQAEQAISRALALTRKSQVQAVRLPVAISAARVAAARGRADDTERALQDLQRVLAEASRTGRIRLELEARLALGEVGVSAGREGAAETLETLERDAAAKRYDLIVRKATAARRHTRNIVPGPRVGTSTRPSAGATAPAGSAG
jgi:tetratricopeptide (TPR) repeat protein